MGEQKSLKNMMMIMMMMMMMMTMMKEITILNIFQKLSQISTYLNWQMSGCALLIVSWQDPVPS
jgi:hypothetical protein